MTKEDFENLNKNTYYCDGCKCEKDIKLFTYRNIRLNNKSTCNICEWFKRHKDINLNYPEEIVRKIVTKLYENEVTIMNDFAEEINMSIEDATNAIHKLRIGNKKMLVRYNCKCCGKESYTTPKDYFESSNKYCSYECYWNDKPNTVGKGKDNVCYNRISTICTNCGKEIEVIPSKFKHTNSFNDNHNFCSYSCYWKFRSKYYKGDKYIHFEYAPEMINRMRLAITKSLSKQNRLDTSIQLKTNEILNKCNIDYKREYTVDYYSIDNYLPDYNLMIEVQGDYWHCTPLKYNENKYSMNKKQYDGINRDKIKKSYIKNHCGINILYLWEKDINQRPDVCEKLILKYIENKGILENYNSFNYDIKYNILCLNQELIIPYQDMKCTEYKHLLKIS